MLAGACSYLLFTIWSPTLGWFTDDANAGAILQNPVLLCPEDFVPDGRMDEFVASNSRRSAAPPATVRSTDGENDGNPEFVCAFVVDAVDNLPSPGKIGAAGPTGFEDAPALTGFGNIPTGFNIGRVSIAWHPTLDRDGDDSNGRGAYFIALDVSAPAGLDFLWSTRPTAFDLDGNGSRLTQTEITIPHSVSEAPGTQPDVYLLALDTDVDGDFDGIIVIGERRHPPLADVATIDPQGVPQLISGQQVQRFVEFIDITGTVQGLPLEQSVRFLDWTGDGILDADDIGVDRVIELSLLNITALPGNVDPSIIHMLLLTHAPSGSFVLRGGDVMIAQFEFPAPVDLSCTNHESCASDEDPCTFEHCEAGRCVRDSVAYGDVNGSGGPGPDLDDLICLLNGIFDYASCPNADLSPFCTPNGVIDLDDLITFLDAFAGLDPCDCSSRFESP